MQLGRRWERIVRRTAALVDLITFIDVVLESRQRAGSAWYRFVIFGIYMLHLSIKKSRAAVFAGWVVALSFPTVASAAPEEIQVYMDEFSETGKFSLDLHTIYVAATRNNANPLPRHQTRITPELSYGLSDHFEAAAYFLTNRAAAGNPQTDGVKVRVRWRPIVPTDKTVWYVALNLELGKLAQRFNPDGSNGELKTIVTWKSADWTAGLNLNFDRPLSSHTATPVTTELDSKLAYRVGDHVQVGLEHYAFNGPLHGQSSAITPNRSTFLVTDFTVSRWDINFGVGQARGNIPDKLIVKAIIGVPI